MSCDTNFALLSHAIEAEKINNNNEYKTNNKSLDSISTFQGFEYWIWNFQLSDTHKIILNTSTMNQLGALAVS